MYKVMLVDDEPIIIRGMKELIDWEKEGFEICGFAYSAQEALEKIDNLNPDIIITDLVMPEIDGIEFIKFIKSSWPNIETIILSGYGEFEYAKAALSNGVCEYLVKPVTRAQLINTIHKAAKSISRRRDSHKEYKNLKIKLQESMPLLRNRYVLDIINGRINDKDEITRRCELVDFKLDGPSMIAIINARGTLDIDHEENSDVYFNFAVKTACEEYLNDHGKGYAIFDGEDICLIGTAMNEELTQTLAFELLNGIWYDIQARYGVDLTIGMGPCFDTLDLIKDSYENARNAFKSSFFLGEGQIIHYKNAAITGKEISSYPNEIVDSIIEEIRYDANSDANKLSDKLIKIFVEAAGRNIETVYQYCYQFCIQLSRINNKSITTSRLKETIYDMQAIRKNKTTSQLSEYMNEILKNYIIELNKFRAEKLNNVINKVVEYIDNHLSGDLTLNALASLVFMNPVYLSTLFKNKTGIMYHDYIFSARMKHAQMLLLDSNMKVYEVAQNAGYSNARSFSDAFKRFCGFTPSNYISNHANNN